MDGVVDNGRPGGNAPGTVDARAFLARLVRFDAAALVRLRAQPSGVLDLWACLPWDVLVARRVPAPHVRDATVSAAELLAALDATPGGLVPRGLAADGLAPVTVALPRRRDAEWRWPLPPGDGTPVENVAAGDLHRVGRAAAAALREAATAGVGGRAVGERVLRDTLLDHVPIVVSVAGEQVEVGQRLVQALLRMGFAPEFGADVQVRVAGPWVGLAGVYGSVWRNRRRGLTLRPGTIPLNE